MATAVYGGSFNPPHIAHVLAAQYVLSVGVVQRVIVVPVYHHAFSKQLAPFDARLEMCRRAFSSDSRIVVSDIESRLPEPSYTLNTLEAIKADLPNEELRLIIGADVLPETAHWHAFDRVKKLAPPLVLGRAGVASKEAPMAVLPEISSSEVRALLKKGDDASKSALARLLPQGVRDLIEKQGLYG